MFCIHMTRLSAFLVSTLALSIAATSASALTIKKAQIKNGQIQVRGIGASPSAEITLDGTSTAKIPVAAGL